jgi:uncharacterized protein (DUF934 family)
MKLLIDGALVDSPYDFRPLTEYLESGGRAVKLDPADDPMALRGHLDTLDAIGLVFPVFRDGRAFSHARLVRGRLGFAGRLVALGHVLPDQYLFLTRLGVDAVAVDENTDLDLWRRALGEFSVRYQPALDGAPTAATLRTRA